MENKKKMYLCSKISKYEKVKCDLRYRRREEPICVFQ